MERTHVALTWRVGVSSVEAVPDEADLVSPVAGLLTGEALGLATCFQRLRDLEEPITT